ncbi:uncharacterized protein LOC129023420 [Pongo pygmaeus]|uniref:uncharacterized protein LOC129023420 n=1 Tax=Pongo pygmaeus TaxID=9600 RepID=UPI00300CF628
MKRMPRCVLPHPLGDSFEPSRKHVRRKPYSTTKVTSGSTFKEVLRRYAVYTIQHRRHHDSWVKKKMYPQEDDFHHTVFSNLERLDKLQPTLEASEESLVHKDRGDGERPVNARVVQVAPLRCESTPCGDAVQDISKEDTVYDIYNEDAVDISDEDTVDISNEAPVHDIFNDAVDISNEAAVRDISNDAVDICNEAAVHDISSEDTIEDISYEDTVYDIANEDTVQDICKKEDAASEPFILGNGTYPEITHFLRKKCPL